MVETTASAWPAAARGTAPAKPPRPGRLARFRREFRFLMVGLPLGVAAFVCVTVGISLGMGLVAILIGLPVFIEVLFMARVFANLERSRAATVTGRALPSHHYDVTERGGTPVQRLAVMLDKQSWRDVVHALVSFPVRIVGFCLATVWVVGGLGEVLYATWSWSLPRDDDTKGLVDLMTGVESRWADIGFNTAVGVVLLLTAVPLVHGLTAAQVALARVLLTNEKQALRARAEQLAAGRRSAVAAEAQTLRRLERDLHDGPQQRLVRLTMDLEAVARRLDSDEVDRARPLVDEMIAQTHEALGELRALSRGIAPPILADRGLGAALAAAAARCPVPVVLGVDVPDGRRFAPVVENTAYFVVAEALTNVAKHAAATRCTVVVLADEQAVHIEVRDDGRGGAHLGKGHGLAGLAERVAAVEGKMAVSSPEGGPTVLTAEVPLLGVDGPD